jgi:hypothetical protein
MPRRGGVMFRHVGGPPARPCDIQFHARIKAAQVPGTLLSVSSLLPHNCLGAGAPLSLFWSFSSSSLLVRAGPPSFLLSTVLSIACSAGTHIPFDHLRTTPYLVIMKYFATLSMATMAAAQMQVMSLAAAPSPAGAMTHTVSILIWRSQGHSLTVYRSSLVD